ncbi:MAG: flippase [Candidatus Woesearchaeota archaeon]
MSLKKRLVTGSIFVGVATIITSLISYLFRLFMVRNLSIADYGLFYSMVSIFLFATTFVDFGRAPAFMKFGSEYLAKNKKGIVKFIINYYFKFKIKMSIIFILLVILCSKFLAQHYFRVEEAFLLFIALGIVYTITDLFFNYLGALFMTFQDQRLYSFYEVSKLSLQLLFLLVFFRAGFGIWGAVFAIFLGPLIASAIFYFAFYKRHFPDFFSIKTNKSSQLIKKISIFAKLNLLYLLGTYILNYTDTYMLTYFTTLKEVGLYNIAVPASKLIIFFSTAITLILMPLISALFAKKQIALMNQLVNMVYKLSLFFILPLGIVMILFSNTALALLFTQESVAAATCLQLLTLSNFFAILFFINMNIFNGIGRPKENTKCILAGTVLNIILNFILIPRYGMNGAAFATLLSYIAMCILSFVYLKRGFRQLKIELSHFLKLAAANIIFFLSIIYLKKIFIIENPWLEGAVVLLISGIVYLALVFITKTFTIKEVKDILEMYKKKA